MMAFWTTLAPAWQSVCLAIVGLLGGALVNHAITTWCWFSRPSSPWARVSKWTFDPEHAAIANSIPPRTWPMRLPVIGWWFMRREAVLYGRGFWVRPMLIELSLAVIFPWMHHEYVTGQLLPVGINPAVLVGFRNWMGQLFFVHLVVVLLMTAATFIDFDERTIPDVITIPGTLFALILSTNTPWMFLPGLDAAGFAPVMFYSPTPPAPSWMGSHGFMMASLVWTMYCFGIADRRWIMRRGIRRAVDYFVLGLTRHWTFKWLVAMWLVGWAFIAVVFRDGGLPWLGLLTSLLGLGIGGGVIWAVRLIGRIALRKEAMGFGDVTLMAMLGAALGWQASIVAFFVSPLAACFIVLIRFAITRDASTPYGPYLCAGTGITVWFWDSIYNGNVRPTLLLAGGELVWVSVAMGLAMLAMLWIWRLIREQVFG
ncbi:MAG: A24 family peptidase [Planctomycetota bacterium]